jgi:hypothetical protein
MPTLQSRCCTTAVLERVRKEHRVEQNDARSQTRIERDHPMALREMVNQGENCDLLPKAPWIRTSAGSPWPVSSNAISTPSDKTRCMRRL